MVFNKKESILKKIIQNRFLRFSIKIILMKNNFYALEISTNPSPNTSRTSCIAMNAAGSVV